MPRRRRESLNSNNYIPVNGRLYIEYWIDGIEDIREDPIHVERLNIQYHPPLTRQEAIGHVNTVYNTEVRLRLPRRDVIDYTVDFSADSQDVLFDPSGHNEENSEYIAQIVVVIHPSDPELLMELLGQNNNNNNNNNNTFINGVPEIVIPHNNNTSTAIPSNSRISIISNESNSSPKKRRNEGISWGYNGGKRRRQGRALASSFGASGTSRRRRTIKRNMKRKGSRRRR